MEKYPETAAITVPAPITSNPSVELVLCSMSPDFNITAPRIAGTDMIKANLAAVSRASPKAIPAKIVEPDRDRPGMMAMAWAIPIRIARGQLRDTPRSFKDVDTSMRIPVTKSIQ